jgi:hypothetical protein
MARALDANNRWGAEEAFLAAIGFLSDGGVETNDGGHGHDAGVVHSEMLLDGPANLCAGIVFILGIELALTLVLQVRGLVRTDMADGGEGRDGPGLVQPDRSSRRSGEQRLELSRLRGGAGCSWSWVGRACVRGRWRGGGGVEG